MRHNISLILGIVLLTFVTATTAAAEQAKVSSIVDGDTIKVKLGKKTETIRIIGIDTPETVDPRKPVQCFGKEASAKMKSLIAGKTVTLERNPAEDRDKYRRLLRYVWLDGQDIGAKMIQDGYAFSYKKYPHPRLETYNKLEQEAREALRGLWGSVCGYQSTNPALESKTSPDPSPKGGCKIKGNISKEKIYHLPGCGSYSKTVIDASAGERWFCTEQEAVAAGWRKAGNCS
jgi:micrococcal nuclease